MVGTQLTRAISARSRQTILALAHRAARWVGQPNVDSHVLPASSGQLSPVFSDYLETLHQARTFCLAAMPLGADTVLSVGASGNWYFEWFARAYGEVNRHIGVEAFLDQPPELPNNVEWVAADLAGPDGVASVASSSVDLVFSGQNIEHLWPEQVVAFLLESNRVLRDGGWLVVDSPNRDVTASYHWTMGEHTVELTPGDASDLLAAAGFEVVTMKGIWLCRDSGKLLDLEPPGTVAGAPQVLERMMLATNRPEDSFLWWAEARKVTTPDIAALEHAVGSIFNDHWEERVGRMRSNEGSPVALADHRDGVRLETGSVGYLLFGPYLALRPGIYELTLELEWADCRDESGPIGVMEVVANQELLGETSVFPHGTSGRTIVNCTIELEELRFGVEARLKSTGTAQLTAPLTLRMVPNPYGPLQIRPGT
jgi:SAM-dependent methyltransferase